MRIEENGFIGGVSMASLSVEIDDKLKQDFSELCDEFGLSMSAAVREFAKTAVRKHKMPFKVSCLDANGFDAATRAELDRRIADMKAGRNIERHGLDEM